MTEPSTLDTVTHRMRTVLTCLRGYASMLSLDGPLNQEQSRHVAKILKAVDQMSQLIRQIAPESETTCPPLEIECSSEVPPRSEPG
jgi:signal transduction histidine kinase